MPSYPVTVSGIFVAGNATVQIVYTTTGDETGDVLATKNVTKNDNGEVFKAAMPVGNVEDSVLDLTDYYKRFDPDDTDQVEEYVYYQGQKKEKIDQLVVGANKLYLKAAATGEVAYFNDFSTTETVADFGTWTAQNTNVTASRILEKLTFGDSEKFDVFNIYKLASDNGRWGKIQFLDEEKAAFAEGKVVDATFLVKLGNSGTKNTGSQDSSIELRDSDDSSLFEIDATKDVKTLTYKIGGASVDGVSTTVTTADDPYMVDYRYADGVAMTPWLKVNAKINFSRSFDNVVLTVSNAETGEVLVDGVHGKTTAKNISQFYVNGARYNSAYAIDEITIKTIEQKDPQVLGSVVVDKSALNGGDIIVNTSTTATDKKNIGKVSYKEYDEDGYLMEKQGTVAWTVAAKAGTTATAAGAAGIAVDATTGAVTITPAAVAGTYVITATDSAKNTVKDSVEITLAANGTEILANLSEDFEGDTYKFSDAALGDLGEGAVVYNSGFSNYGKVLSVVAKKTTMSDTTNFATASTGVKVVNKFTMFNSWLSGGSPCVVTLKNSDGKEIMKLTYDTSTCNVSALTIGGANPQKYNGTSYDEAAAVEAFTFQSKYNDTTGANGWTGGNKGQKLSNTIAYNPTVETTLESDGTVTVVLTPSRATSAEPAPITYKGTIEGATESKANFATMEIDESGITNADRASCFDNIVTSVVKAAN